MSGFELIEIGNIFGGRNKRGRRVGKEFLAYLEKLGRELDPSLADDVSGSIGALILGWNEFFPQLREYEESHPPTLLVPDPGSLVGFLKNARKVYREAHPPNTKRGPKFSEGRVLSWIADLEHKLKRQPTRKEIIAHITDKDQCRSNPVSQRTADKIVKLYHLLNSKKLKLSKTDAQWLKKNFGSKGLRPNWWRDKQHQLFSARIDASGTSKQIQNYFVMSNRDLAEERERLEALRIRMTFHDEN